MTYEEWLAANPVAPRTEELYKCWVAAQNALPIIGYGWFEDGVLAGALPERTPLLFITPLLGQGASTPEERRKFGGRHDD